MMLVRIFFLLLFIVIPLQTEAATYYFSTSGDDSGAGTYASPYKTIEKANSVLTALSNGEDKVAFKCGDDWDTADEWGSATYLNINVSGLGVGQEFYICAYEGDGDTTLEGGETLPIIDGYDTKPSNVGDGLVWVKNSNDYVKIMDLDVRRSEGHGIKTGIGSDYCIITQCLIDDIYGTPIIFYQGTHNTATYNRTSNGSRQLPASPNGGIASNESTYSTITNNYVYRSNMEGISLGNNDTCTDNLISDCRTVGIYLNRASNATVTNNVLIGTSYASTMGFVTSGWQGHGIALALESTASADVDGNVIDHNTVVNFASGIRCYDSSGSYDIATNYVYNNTFIDNYRNIWLTNTDDQLDAGAVTFKNNISYSPSASSSHTFITGSSLDNWTFDYNLWGADSAPSGAFSGANDITGVPFSKTSWRDGTLDAVTDLSEADFIPIAYAIDTGENLGATYDDSINGITSTFITTNPHPAIGTAINISTADQDLSGSGWDIGALLNTPVITIAATDATATEEGPTTGTFTFTCTPNCSNLDVDYSWSGGATLNVDFNADDEDGTITLDGATGTITVTPVDDSDVESEENVTMTVDSGSGYGVGSPSYASVVIADNDDPSPPPGGATVTIGEGSYNVTIGGGSLTLTISPDS